MNGYILISRSILDSDIWKMPPIYLKVWIYLLTNAMFADKGNLKRGQLFTSTQEIADNCSYYKGCVKVTPTRKEIWHVIEWLRNPHVRDTVGDTKGTMVGTTKGTHGMVVTICNYNKYQDPKSYVRDNEGDTAGATKGTPCGFEGNNINNTNNNTRKKVIQEYIEERKARSLS